MTVPLIPYDRAIEAARSALLGDLMGEAPISTVGSIRQYHTLLFQRLQRYLWLEARHVSSLSFVKDTEATHDRLLAFMPPREQAFTIEESVQERTIPDRISREEMYFGICDVLRKRSTCLRGKVGCIVVRDRRVIAMGYNGAPLGTPHCFELGCNVPDDQHILGCQRAIHAEANAIAFAARGGVNSDGCEVWCTHGPCLNCAQLMLSAGIVKVHYKTPYRIDDGLRLLDRANVPAVQYHYE
jgi:dCMP deaminase